MGKTALNEEKRALRRELKQRRADLGKAKRESASLEMARRVAEHPEFDARDLILGYYPVGEEIDLVPLWEEVLRRGKRLAFPRCFEGTLRFFEVRALSELIPAEYGIPSPPDTAEEVRDVQKALCVVPALSCDRSGVRMGYGGGYYDRFLQNARGVYTICCVFDDLFSPTPLVREKHDVCVDTIITERGELKVYEA